MGTPWTPRFSVGVYTFIQGSWQKEATLKEIESGLKKIRNYGKIEGVEFYYPQEFKECKTSDVRELCVRMGLHPANVFADFMGSGYGPKGSISSSDKKVRAAAIQTVKEAIAVAQDLGAPNVTIWIPNDGYDYPFEQDYPAAWSRLTDALRELTSYANSIRLAVEYRPFFPRSHSLLGSGAKTLALASEIGAPNIGVQLEVSHTLMAQEGVAEIVALAAMRNRLFHLHLNDSYPVMDNALIFGSVSFWDCVEAIYWLREMNYQGFLGLDVVEEWVGPSLENARFMVDLVDSLDGREFKSLLAKGDVVGTQRLLWKALGIVRGKR